MSLPHFFFYIIVPNAAARLQRTGLAAYVHFSICKIGHRRPDLESEAAENVWLEIQTRMSSVLVGYI